MGTDSSRAPKSRKSVVWIYRSDSACPVNLSVTDFASKYARTKMFKQHKSVFNVICQTQNCKIYLHLKRSEVFNIWNVQQPQLHSKVAISTQKRKIIYVKSSIYGYDVKTTFFNFFLTYAKISSNIQMEWPSTTNGCQLRKVGVRVENFSLSPVITFLSKRGVKLFLRKFEPVSVLSLFSFQARFVISTCYANV